MSHTYSYNAWSSEKPIGFRAKLVNGNDEVAVVTIGTLITSIDWLMNECDLYLSIEQLYELHAVIGSTLSEHASLGLNLCENELRTLSI